MTRLAASLVENMVNALDGKRAEEPTPTKAKAQPEQETLAEFFQKALRGETHYTKDLTRHRHADPVDDLIRQLTELGV